MRLLVAILAAAALLADCGSTSTPSSTGGCQKIKVVTTVTQVSAITRAVGGDCVELTALLKSSDDPHAYELRPADVVKLSDAKLIVKSGAGLDKWLDKSIQAAAPAAPVVDLSSSAKLRKGDEGDDPHWWYDVDNDKTATDALANKLGELNAANKDAYARNVRRLQGPPRRRREAGSCAHRSHSR